MNVLIVGLGSIARKHIAALRSLDPEVQIYALRSTRFSNSVDGVTDLFSMKEVEEYSFDFAIISNPTSEHQKTIQQMGVLNIPLFIEKPLSHQLDVKETVAEIERKNILTYVACNLRFLDALLFTKQYIAGSSLRINEINVYCGSYLPSWRGEGVDYTMNYSAIPELGGGVHIDLIHEIDYIYWLCGTPSCTQRIFSSSSSLGIKSYDYANYCLCYDDYHVSIILNYYRRDARRSLEIVCEGETIYVDLLENCVSIDGEIAFRSSQRIADTYQLQLAYFLDCLRVGKPTFNTITDAYNVLQICLES